MNALGLFSGIGGFELGLQRAGINIAAMCEIDPYCRAVLRKHWPGVPIFEDIRRLDSEEIQERCFMLGGSIDVICGGFPCQDISVAGRGAGLEGKRSGLWSEFFRLIREIQPKYVLVENVSALLGRGMATVLGDLAKIGYDAEWHCIPASYVGAKHKRDRVWIIAHPHREGLQERFLQPGIQGEERRDDDGENASLDPWWTAEPGVVRRLHGLSFELDIIGLLDESSHSPEAIAKAQIAIRRVLLYVWQHKDLAKTSPQLYRRGLCDSVSEMSHPNPHGGWLLGARLEEDEGLCDLWEAVCAKPYEETQNLQRALLERARSKKRPKALGSRKDRIKALGNAVYPAIPEMLGRAIMSNARAASALVEAT